MATYDQIQFRKPSANPEFRTQFPGILASNIPTGGQHGDSVLKNDTGYEPEDWSIVGASLTNPATLIVVNDLVEGEAVVPTGFTDAGWVDLNGTVQIAVNINANACDLQGVDATSFATYTGSGVLNRTEARVHARLTSPVSGVTLRGDGSGNYPSGPAIVAEYQLRIRGATDGTANIYLVEAPADLVGATSFDFSQSGQLSGFPSPSGSVTASFTTTGTLSGDSGSISAATSVAFGADAALSGFGELQGSTTVAFDTSGAIVPEGDLVGATSFSFSATGEIVDPGQISGSATAAFSAIGMLISASDLQAMGFFSVSTAATIGGFPTLMASTDAQFAASGTLTDAVQLEGSIGFGFSATGTISVQGQIEGTAMLGFDAVGSLYAQTRRGPFFETVDDMDANMVAIFGEDVVYLPVGGSPVTIKAIFFDPYEREELGDMSFEGNQPAAYPHTQDVPNAAQGDLITARGKQYIVKEVALDEGTLARLVLKS